MSRPSNDELCAKFRGLLTTEFYVEGAGNRDHHATLRLTKPWRNDLWKAFREIEDRLCPSKDGGPK